MDQLLGGAIAEIEGYEEHATSDDDDDDDEDDEDDVDQKPTGKKGSLAAGQKGGAKGGKAATLKQPAATKKRGAATKTRSAKSAASGASAASASTTAGGADDSAVGGGFKGPLKAAFKQFKVKQGKQAMMYSVRRHRLCCFSGWVGGR